MAAMLGSFDDVPGPDEHQHAPPGVDPRVPNAARIYDAYLGGVDNFAADRAQVGKAAPYVAAVTMARSNRDFLEYAVDELVQQGIRQFIDLGSGLPTCRNSHEVAQAAAPAARVVYVDRDPQVVAHARELLRASGAGRLVTVVQEDIRNASAILRHRDVARLIDLTRPVGLLAIAVMHLVDVDANGLVRTFRESLAPGSGLALTHGTGRPDVISKIDRLPWSEATPEVIRPPGTVEALFDGWELQPPGLVRVEQFLRDGGPVPRGEEPPLWLAGGLAYLPRRHGLFRQWRRHARTRHPRTLLSIP